MTTATRTPRTKPARRVQVGAPCNGTYAVCMTIGAGETARHFGYYIRRIPSDFGTAFRVEKFLSERVEGEPSEYDVLLDLAGGCHSCECLGHERWGHCKHVEALLALIASGKIDTPAAKQSA